MDDDTDYYSSDEDYPTDEWSPDNHTPPRPTKAEIQVPEIQAPEVPAPEIPRTEDASFASGVDVPPVRHITRYSHLVQHFRQRVFDFFGVPFG
jgi:hypothetical protein